MPETEPEHASTRSYTAVVVAALLVAAAMPFVGFAFDGRDDAELSITSEPWADVSIDGARVGRTVLRHSLAPGRHVVVLRNPSGLERRIEIELAPGEHKRLSVRLDE